MKYLIAKTIIYTTAVFLCALVVVKVGTELLVQAAMILEGVADRSLLKNNSMVATIAVYCYIPELIFFGAIGGWYLAQWLEGRLFSDWFAPIVTLL
jgi:hypothetical protein